MADDLKKVANAAQSAGEAAKSAHQEAIVAANTAQSAGEAAKVAHDEATKAANLAQSAGKAAKELKIVTDDHEERLGAIEDHLESQPTPQPSPAQPTAAPAATVAPQLRTDGNIPDLPDPEVFVVEGGLVIDRVKRTWLNINQLGEDERDLDATSEPSTPTPIRQASIPPRQPQPLHRTLTRAEVEEQTFRRQPERFTDIVEHERRQPLRFVKTEQILNDVRQYGKEFAENLYGVREVFEAMLQEEGRQPASETTTPSVLEQSRTKQKEKDGDKLHPVWIVGLAVLVIAILIALAILFSSMGKGKQQSSIPTPTPTTQSAPTTNTSKSESNFTFQKGSLSGANVTFNGGSIPESNQAPQTEE